MSTEAEEVERLTKQFDTSLAVNMKLLTLMSKLLDELFELRKRVKELENP